MPADLKYRIPFDSSGRFPPAVSPDVRAGESVVSQTVKSLPPQHAAIGTPENPQRFRGEPKWSIVRTHSRSRAMDDNSVRHKRCLGSQFGLSRLSAIPVAVIRPYRKPPAQAGGLSGRSPGSRPGLSRTSSRPEPTQCAVPNRIARADFFHGQLGSAGNPTLPSRLPLGRSC